MFTEVNYSYISSLIVSGITASIGVHHYIICRKRNNVRTHFAFSLSCVSFSLLIMCAAAVMIISRQPLPWMVLRLAGLCTALPFFLWFLAQWKNVPAAAVSLGMLLAASVNDTLVLTGLLRSMLVAEYAFLLIASIITPLLRSGIRYRDILNGTLHDVASSFISVFESAKDAMLIIQNERIIICNEATFEMFKSNHRKIIGKSLHKLAPKNQPDGTSSHITMKEKMVMTLRQKGQFCECRFCRGDGTPFTAEVSFSLIGGQENDSILAVIRDVESKKNLVEELHRHQEHLQELVRERTEELSQTVARLEREIAEKKIIEEQHFASERRFKDLTDLLPAVIYETDLKGNITYVNDYTYTISGYSREELQEGIDISRFYSESDYKRLYYDTLDLLSTGHMPPTEYEIIKKDGTVISILLNNSIINGKEHPKGFRGVITDITQMKQVQRELIDMMNAAKSANRSKSVFLANISHELKTPLNSILGYCRMLEMRRVGELNPKQEEFLACIKESGQHLLVIINELLDISKIQVGKMEFRMENIDLHDLLRGTAITMMPLASEKHLTVETDIESDLGMVRGDATRLREVIYNLLSNAVKFTEQGKRIGVRGRKIDKTATITVWDEGPGIPREFHDKIFEPFVQISIDNSVKNQGSGLGLAISNKIIDFHGGTISIISEEGKGSEFTVNLPLIEV